MIWSIIIGLVVGLLARAIKPGADGMGWILTIILGMVGSSVGHFIANTLGIYANGVGGLIISVIGAIIVLFVYEFIASRARR